jgi:hypothetical protein
MSFFAEVVMRILRKSYAKSCRKRASLLNSISAATAAAAAAGSTPNSYSTATPIQQQQFVDSAQLHHQYHPTGFSSSCPPGLTMSTAVQQQSLAQQNRSGNTGPGVFG